MDRLKRIDEAGLSASTAFQLRIKALHIDLLEEMLARGLTPEHLAAEWEAEFGQALEQVHQEEVRRFVKRWELGSKSKRRFIPSRRRSP